MKGIARFRIEAFGEEPSEVKSGRETSVENQFSCTQFEVSFVTVRKN